MGSKSSLSAADYVYVEYLHGPKRRGWRSSSSDSIWSPPIVFRLFLVGLSSDAFISMYLNENTISIVTETAFTTQNIQVISFCHNQKSRIVFFN